MNTDNFLKVQQPQIMMKKKANPEESIASSLPKLDFSKKKAPKHTAMNMSEDQDLPDAKSVSSEAKLKTFAGEEGSTTDPQRQQKSKYSNYPEAPSPKSNVSPPAPNTVTSYQELLMEFFTAATVCHECIVETDSEGHHNFQGPSPDEIAICKGARDIGCTFLGSNSQGQIELEYFGQKKSLELIMVRLSLL
jgi:magnesium-transporting ATPase (P-type)